MAASFRGSKRLLLVLLPFLLVSRQRMPFFEAGGTAGILARSFLSEKNGLSFRSVHRTSNQEIELIILASPVDLR